MCGYKVSNCWKFKDGEEKEINFQASHLGFP